MQQAEGTPPSPSSFSPPPAAAAPAAGVVVACLSCHAGKRRCSGARPACERCATLHRVCAYPPPPVTAGAPPSRKRGPATAGGIVTKLKRRIEALEQQLAGQPTGVEHHRYGASELRWTEDELQQEEDEGATSCHCTKRRTLMASWHSPIAGTPSTLSLHPPAAAASASSSRVLPSLSFLPLWMAFFDQLACDFILPAAAAISRSPPALPASPTWHLPLTSPGGGPRLLHVSVPSLSEAMLHSMLREMAHALRFASRTHGEASLHVHAQPGGSGKEQSGTRSSPLWFLKCRETMDEQHVDSAWEASGFYPRDDVAPSAASFSLPPPSSSSLSSSSSVFLASSSSFSSRYLPPLLRRQPAHVAWKDDYSLRFKAAEKYQQDDRHASEITSQEWRSGVDEAHRWATSSASGSASARGAPAPGGLVLHGMICALEEPPFSPTEPPAAALSSTQSHPPRVRHRPSVVRPIKFAIRVVALDRPAVSQEFIFGIIDEAQHEEQYPAEQQGDRGHRPAARMDRLSHSQLTSSAATPHDASRHKDDALFGLPPLPAVGASTLASPFREVESAASGLVASASDHMVVTLGAPFEYDDATTLDQQQQEELPSALLDMYMAAGHPFDAITSFEAGDSEAGLQAESSSAER